MRPLAKAITDFNTMPSKKTSSPPMQVSQRGGRLSTLEQLNLEFHAVLQIKLTNWAQDLDFLRRCEALATHLAAYQLLPFSERKQAFLAHINWKFRINADHLAAFYERGAKAGHTFNYHQKCAIQLAFDRGELDGLSHLLTQYGVPAPTVRMLVDYAECASESDTRNHLHSELSAPSKLRKEVGERDVEFEILKALFASFTWVSLPSKDMHRFYDPAFDDAKYRPSFWDEIQARAPKLFHRDEAVHLLVIERSWAAQFTSLRSLRDSLLCRVRDSYQALNNYGFLLVLVQPITVENREVSWELAADIALFGEKHLEQPLDRAYFRHEKIKAETLAHIPALDPECAHFELANEGFTYRDCFVLRRTGSAGIEQLLVLQKNHRDETVVPCPTCRSAEVEGNSYPSLGVKSWECCNPLCPDRSKYNRGKRYSFRGLSMQEAIDDERNDIPTEFVRKWRRDVVEITSHVEVIELMVRHYSIWGDQIRCYGSLDDQQGELLGRFLRWERMPSVGTGEAVDWFDNAAFFKRFGAPSRAAPYAGIQLGDEIFQVRCGDSRQILKTLHADSIDGAVTSPPYYNAREYSQWPNMYCYLHDMFEVNTEVFRVLKPGSVYFYNIFDYFDNENIIALSAMGQKRVTLSAYTVDLFRRIGFECIGNIVWDKGEIEGKRGFNAGNFAPFYQSPFNCWEHVLVFRKPGGDPRSSIRSRVLQAKPVIKMVRGKNTHGHTAPYPEEIPRLCVDLLPPGAVVLDPFGGSLTTGRVAASAGRRAICIEQSREYCDLGLSLYSPSALLQTALAFS